ncbi:MAG: hypothetical protein JRG73_07260 [Deltaproteobacteria bacterium]|nr:hypothetical protein [Deltaproteobacteria bacterium]MBW2306723.1 hypothetical protein [Deltaproteobacteria bacterium]
MPEMKEMTCGKRGELPDVELVRQAEAFIDYRRRGGKSFTIWARSKRFHPIDHERIKAAVLNLTTRAAAIQSNRESGDCFASTCSR